MRLNAEEIAAIKAAVHKFDPSAQIYLFGSRTDKQKKGGDIDLLVLSKTLTLAHRLDIKFELFRDFEDQKIDIVIAENDNDPFVQIALSTGVLL
ncbi:MAG: nucleotidyltransferase domain-containing protein [Chlamydiae bacterium]|nr:nucleotidyltransferase domain-containing protein [Chlamydiota bacterium]